jgi:hypothetical protein
MGQYLITGLIKIISINKSDVKSKYSNKTISLDQIKSAVYKSINSDNYNFTETDECYIWSIKPSLFDKDFEIFLEDQYLIYEKDKLKGGQKEIIEKIKEIQSGEEIIKIAEESTNVYFRCINNIYDSFTILHDGMWHDYVYADFTLIALFVDGKIIMECYGSILDYFSSILRKQHTLYPVAECMGVFIST